MFGHILWDCHRIYANAMKSKFDCLLSQDNSPEMSTYKALKEKIFNEIISRNGASNGCVNFLLSRAECTLISSIERGYYGGWYAKWTTPYGLYLKAELGINLCICTLSVEEQTTPDCGWINLTISWNDPQKMFDSYTRALSDIKLLIKKSTL